MTGWFSSLACRERALPQLQATAKTYTSEKLSLMPDSGQYSDPLSYYSTSIVMSSSFSQIVSQKGKQLTRSRSLYVQSRCLLKYTIKSRKLL